MIADATVRSKINPVQSAEFALGEAIGKVDGIQLAVAKRCFVMAKKSGATDSITLTFTIYFFNLDMKLIRIVYDKMGKHYDNLDKKDKRL